MKFIHTIINVLILTSFTTDVQAFVGVSSVLSKSSISQSQSVNSVPIIFEIERNTLSISTSSNNDHHHIRRNAVLSSSSSSTNNNNNNNENIFELMVDLPPSRSGLSASMRIESILSVPSELVVVRYQIPFGLDVAPKNGLAVCTKDGTGGEKVNDILRYTSHWTLGLPRGDGLLTTAASFAGGLSWQCNMFDVIKEAKVWEQVVQALVSNTPSRTDEVLLIFERATDPTTLPPELR